MPHETNTTDDDSQSMSSRYARLTDESSKLKLTGGSSGGGSNSLKGFVNGNSSFSSSSKKMMMKKKKSKSGGGKMKECNSSLSEPLTTSAENGNDHEWDDNSATNGIDIELGRVGGMDKNNDNGSAIMMDTDDPFYVFREDLLRKLELVEEGLSRYLRVVHGTDTAANTHNVKDTKKQLKRHLKNAESTLKDLQTTVRLVENQRDKFPNINDDELNDRRTLVETSLERITKAKHDMNSDGVKAKLLADERAMALRRQGMGGMDKDDGVHRSNLERENAAFIADSQATTSLMLQQQDETLDELDEAVTRVGHMAGSIHEEIGLQNKMLTDLEDDLADAEEKLGLVMGKLAKLLKTKSKCQLGTILVLSLVVLVLFFLVIYT